MKPLTSDEQLDLLDESGKKIGKTASYWEVHRKGLIHQTAHVWLLNSKGELLIQKRSPIVPSNPNKWDVSAAGHVSSGQTMAEGAVREVEEEIGLVVAPNDIKFLSSIQIQTSQQNGTYLNHEFQNVYLLKKDININQLKPDCKEVSELKWISLLELKEHIDSPDFVSHPEEYQKLFAYLEKNYQK